MAKTIQPIGPRLIVLPIEKKEEKVEGSTIIIPETANANLSSGVVVAAAKEFEHLIKVGDEVIFSTGTGVGTFYQGKPHLFLTVSEIWGITSSAN
jgi:co-chaperonin GroES (HSP10)